ncbi:MAG: EAL domain-containing protein, partial [Gammaproteobacteria bacterium]|nr:EAL domain-containing protein [Gammaproteobacteria bacterium]
LKDGNLAHRIDINSTDEIGDVARSFNTMAQHLESTQQSLKVEHYALERESRRMETLLNGVNAVVFEANPCTKQFIYVSNEAENLLGYTSDEWLEQGFWGLHVHPDDQGWTEHVLQQQLEEMGDFVMDYRMLHHRGDYLWIRSIHNIEETNGEKICRGLLINIDEQKKTEERIIYLADHDALTGQYNRRRFQEELEHQIAYAQRFSQQGALLFIDLDQFKYINDTFGHHAGDECLLTVSRCLSDKLRNIDILGRLGGDEFGVILPHTQIEDAEKVSQHLLENLSHETLLSQGLTAPISASIGIATFPDNGISPSDLLAKADAAMYAAKRQGRNQYHTYLQNDETLVKMKAKVHWEDKIHRALAEDRFLLQFQPIVDLQTGQAIHHEVLLRLADDEGKYIYPHSFLDTAEHFGLILEIDKWVLQNAIKIQGESIQNGEPIVLAINISGRNFGNTQLLQVLSESLEQYQADPHALIFEVTETAAVENFGRARSFIESLRSLGCRFALDDFGAGHSSFNYLRNLPVDMIKIDGTFIRNLHQNQFDRIIVKAISDVAEGLAIMTIAEFVENNEIKEYLLELGIRYGQGFHLGKPKALTQEEKKTEPVMD